ncbi:uncharacterized protein LOC114334819 [Diabrotica virgifera virgifera]|uniref:Uncharacterized protein LOC114334819 n=1 Tax=Diabrotica virgifera virgifera TaxID=50390 RepID=A0A6P7G0Z6_DIAVI|nr:uncharacterized protein LOC114334819 [Diabrotica virgifera virgifera]
MAPPTKKDLGIVLFDVASPKKSELLNGLMKFCCFKKYSDCKSMYRLILVNTAETNNDFNYPHIYTSEEEDFNPNEIFDIVENAEPGQSDWIDAVSLGVHHLEEAAEMKGLVTLQLIFFTTLDETNPLNYDRAKLNSLMVKMNELDIFFYIIGPDVQLPFVITSTQCIPRCMNGLQLPDGNQNLSTAKKLVKSVSNGVMCNTKIGLNLLFSYKNSAGMQPWKVPLAFGTNFSLPVSTSKIYRSDEKVQLKLISSVSRSFVRALAEDRNVLVNEDDMVRGISFHGKFIQVDDNMFKTETVRSFDVIGFSHAKFFPETLLRGKETFYVLPDQIDDTGEAFQLFTHLVKVMAEKNIYGIVRKVYAKNTKARFYALIPNLDYEPKCLIMASLPYDGYVTPHKYEEPKCPKEPIIQDDFSNFFNSLIIENPGAKTGTTLGPTMLLDINQHKLASAVTKKCLQRNDLDMEALDVKDLERAPNNEFFEGLKRSWPAREVQQPTESL